MLKIIYEIEIQVGMNQTIFGVDLALLFDDIYR